MLLSLLLCFLPYLSCVSGGDADTPVRLTRFTDGAHPYLALFCSSAGDCAACMPAIREMSSRIAARRPDARIAHVFDTRSAVAAGLFRRVNDIPDTVLPDDEYLIRKQYGGKGTPFLIFIDAHGKRSVPVHLKSADAEEQLNFILDSLPKELPRPTPSPGRRGASAMLVFRDTIHLRSGGEAPGFLLPISLGYLDAAGAIALYDLRARQVHYFDTRGRETGFFGFEGSEAAPLICPFCFSRLVSLGGEGDFAMFINDEFAGAKGKYIVTIGRLGRVVRIDTLGQSGNDAAFDVLGRMRYDPKRKDFFIARSARCTVPRARPPSVDAIARYTRDGDFAGWFGRNSGDALTTAIPASMTPVLFDLDSAGNVWVCSALGDSLIRYGNGLEETAVIPFRRLHSGPVPPLPEGAEGDPELFHDWQSSIPANDILEIVHGKYITLQYHSGGEKKGGGMDYLCMYDLQGNKLMEDFAIPGPLFYVDPEWNAYFLDPESEHTRWLRYRITGLN